jgi:hypothetical protein
MFSSNASQVSNNVKYIEDVFSTWLRTGTGSSTTITTGLDASTNKALVWTKSRSAATNHKLTDTVRGATKALISNTTGAQTTDTNGLTAFSSTGYTIGSDTNYNNSGATYVDWEFVATPKFFDVVTYTGNGADNRAIPHSLGSAPGFIVVKRTDSASNWFAYQRQLDFGEDNVPIIYLNTTDGQSFTGMAFQTQVGIGNSNNPALNFIVRTPANANGATYVAYLFAHNAGGFGLTGTDNVISCGSFTANGTGNTTVNLAYEPQWLMFKRTDADGDWKMRDNMRGFFVAPNNSSKGLIANSTSAESDQGDMVVTNTGFSTGGSGGLAPSGTYIYIAIRRGPMKVPTDATKVFAPVLYTGNGASGRLISGAGFPPDLLIQTARSASENREFDDRLRGGGSTAMNALFSNSTNAEAADSGSVQLLNQDGFTVRSFGNGSGVTYVGECFRRAPGFFDEVCWTGTGSYAFVNHNLTVTPELLISKSRTSSPGINDWVVSTATRYAFLNLTNSFTNLASTLTPTTFEPAVDSNGVNYVTYLFATCPGVSKVGTYTGNGSTQTIDCGLTGGARFVLIKRTDSTGDWRVVDTARGMMAGTDPYLSLNTTAAEVNANNVYTTAGGFQLVSSDANFNANSGSYIFLAVA